MKKIKLKFLLERIYPEVLYSIVRVFTCDTDAAGLLENIELERHFDKGHNKSILGIDNKKEILIFCNSTFQEVTKGYAGGSSTLILELAETLAINRKVTLVTFPNKTSNRGKTKSNSQSEVDIEFFTRNTPTSFLFLLPRLVGKKFVKVMTHSKEHVQLKAFFGTLHPILISIISKIDLVFQFHLRNLIERKNPDVVFNAIGISGGILEKIAHSLDKEVLFLENTINYAQCKELMGNSHLSKLVSGLIAGVEIKCIKNHDKTICLSFEDKKILTDNFGIPKEKIYVFTYAPRISPYKSKIDIKASIKYNKNIKGVCGFVGSSFDANIDSVNSIIKIAEELPEVVFLIIGSIGLAFKNKYHPENLFFTGIVDDAIPYLHLCDVLINPRISCNYGTVTKMGEYLGLGKPILTTMSGRRGYYVKNGRELIIEDDLTKWSEIILKLLNDEKLRQELSQRSKAYYWKIKNQSINY